ncbi:MAG: hypothetical protein KDA58_16310, partial [Planctomycetaceae bacterium]|nr:hypothetical protein [Planctomycetaceae bacterium]
NLQPVTSQATATYAEIPLAYDQLPTLEQLKQDATSSNIYVAARAGALARQIESGTPLSPTYPYPVQMWKLGQNVKWVILGGEVVVDYALRLKTELGDEVFENQNVWVTAYSNDVMAYIPSRRVLGEGGYEGGGAMVYYGLPSVWAPNVEDLILAEVTRQVRQQPTK